MHFLKEALGALAVCALSSAVAAADEAPATETILFIRHGEKQPKGLGQLDCRGLNRSLALPGVLRRKYRRIDVVFAPDPAQQKADGMGEDVEVARYDYVRPLATVEPTAVAFGLPVHTGIGYADIAALQAALLSPAYRDKVVLVAWEHHHLNDLVPSLVAALGGDPKAVPEWTKKDFDSIWRVTIARAGATTRVGFDHDEQGLDDLPTTCPAGP